MNNISLPDARMIEVMEYAVSNGIAKNEGEYWDRIKYPRTGLSNVRKGLQSFRIGHIINACNLTGVSADWILGIEPEMFRVQQKSVTQTLKEIVAEMEGKRHHIIRKQGFAKNNAYA